MAAEANIGASVLTAAAGRAAKAPQRPDSGCLGSTIMVLRDSGSPLRQHGAMGSLFVVGAGGFGREVIEIVLAINDSDFRWELIGIVDDSPSVEDVQRVRELGLSVLGTVQDAIAHQPRSARFVLGIGSSSARRALSAQLENEGFRAAALTHPDSSVGSRIALGQGTILAAGARLSTNVALGRYVHIDQGATVGHDVEIGDFARLNPQACVSGHVRIGCGALVGANATVLQGLVVGADAIVGAGAVVTRSVAAGAIVKGVPAG